MKWEVIAEVSRKNQFSLPFDNQVVVLKKSRFCKESGKKGTF